MGLDSLAEMRRSIWSATFTQVTLFENIDDISANIIVDEITYSIERYEPRVDLINVQAFPNFDNNSFDVVIVYDIIGADVPAQELQFALQSTR